MIIKSHVVGPLDNFRAKHQQLLAISEFSDNKMRRVLEQRMQKWLDSHPDAWGTGPTLPSVDKALDTGLDMEPLSFGANRVIRWSSGGEARVAVVVVPSDGTIVVQGKEFKGPLALLKEWFANHALELNAEEADEDYTRAVLEIARTFDGLV